MPVAEHGLLRLPISSRPWRAAGYLLVRTPLPGVALSATAISFESGSTAWRVLGLPMLMVGYLILTVITTVTERRAVAILGQSQIRDPHLIDDGEPSLAALRRRLRQPATWREVAHG